MKSKEEKCAEVRDFKAECLEIRTGRGLGATGLEPVTSAV